VPSERREFLDYLGAQAINGAATDGMENRININQQEKES
jgi:hypothetical protein